MNAFFLAACLVSVLRQTRRLAVNYEMPILVTLFGGLLLLAHLPSIPPPAWFGSGVGKK